MNINRPMRVCPECGDRFRATHGRARFCTTAHKVAFHGRNRDRGKMIVPMLQVWRRGRSKANAPASKYAFAQVCALIDLWNEEDAKAGRRPDVAVHDRREAGWSAIDSLDARTF